MMRYLNYLEDYKEFLGNHVGLSDVEISAIETDLSIKLPQAYKEFLRFFGKKSGNVLASYYVTYPVLLEIKEDVIDLLSDLEEGQEGMFALSKYYFFFAEWQGYIFYYFDCSTDEDDPAVYVLNDGLEVEKYYDNFSTFVLEEGIKTMYSYKKSKGL